jgi:putative transposase
MISFIDEHRSVLGVEPICRLLPIAPSTYYEVIAKRTDVDRLSARERNDIAMKVEIRRVFNENFQVYGVRKVWRQLQREGYDIARCTVARLMRMMGLQGVIRGKPVKTTVSDKSAPCPLDRVNRQFFAPAPNMLWLSDFTYVATWQGFVYVAFVIDAFARRIVGWRASRTAHAGFVLDALDQALHDRRPVKRGGLVHHSDRGSQYVSIRYSERLAEAGIEPSVGSVGDLRQCSRRNDQRSLQGRGHPSARTMAQLRSRGVRHARMGRLVQPPSSSGAHREYSASRGRRTILRHAGRTSYGRIT